MSESVDPSEIEIIVGAPRHPTRHIGRAVSSTQCMYVMHSALCKANVADLRCTYFTALDAGLDVKAWTGWEDRPVVLGLDGRGLIPLRDAVGESENEAGNEEGEG